MSLWLALWIGFFPVATPLLPPGEADPLSAPRCPCGPGWNSWSPCG